MYLTVSTHLKDGDKVEARKVDGSFVEAADYFTLKLGTEDSEVVVYMSPENLHRIMVALSNAAMEGVTV